MTASHSSTDIVVSIRSRRKPALLTSTSSPPNDSIAVCTSRPAPSQSAMSSVLATASPPAARISSTTCWAGPADEPSPSREVPMSLTTTFAPSAAKANACARPRPLPAPVTMTTRPSHKLICAPPARPSPEVGLTAVGHQRRPGHVGGVVTEQEGDGAADVLLQVTDAAERDRRDELVELLRRELAPHLQARRQPVGDHVVDANPVLAPLQRSHPRQGADHLLGAGVEREPGQVVAQRRAGAEVDDRAPRLLERRIRGLHEPQRAEETALPRPPRVLLGDVQHRAERDHLRVVDQPVDVTEALERRRDRRVDLVAAPDVALHGQRFDPAHPDVLSGLLDLVQCPTGSDDVRAFSCRGERDALPDALPGTRDEDHLAVEPAHWLPPGF